MAEKKNKLCVEINLLPAEYRRLKMIKLDLRSSYCMANGRPCEL